MTLLPDGDRILLGPGPSLTAPRVMRAMAAPTLSHLDPQFVRMLDDVRLRLLRVFRAADYSFAFAVSGTGTSGMEAAVANLVREGTRATVVVTGYFGDRLAEMCDRYGAVVTRLDVEWGRSKSRRRARRDTPTLVGGMVHHPDADQPDGAEHDHVQHFAAASAGVFRGWPGRLRYADWPAADVRSG